MLQCSRNCARLGTTVAWCRHGCSAYVGMHSEVGTVMVGCSAEEVSRAPGWMLVWFGYDFSGSGTCFWKGVENGSRPKSLFVRPPCHRL